MSFTENFHPSNEKSMQQVLNRNKTQKPAERELLKEAQTPASNALLPCFLRLSQCAAHEVPQIRGSSRGAAEAGGHESLAAAHQPSAGKQLPVAEVNSLL